MHLKLGTYNYYNELFKLYNDNVFDSLHILVVT